MHTTDYVRDDDESQPLIRNESDIKSENIDALINNRFDYGQIAGYSQKF